VGMTVSDPLGAAADPALPAVARALDPQAVKKLFKRRLPLLAGPDGLVRPRRARVTRHKPGRRCVLEYDVKVERPGAPPEHVTLVGKVRARRFGAADFRLLRAVWEAGFDAQSPDGISVPEPVGVIPRLQLWLQRKVPGRVATGLLDGPGGPALARRVAEAAHKLHRAGVPAARRHTLADELCILRDCLDAVAQDRPAWAGRLGRLFESCTRLAAATPDPVRRGVHRDFYADQVIVDGPRLYLLDFDLYCAGDPGLDVGNFLGHVTEQALRTRGDPAALAEVERELEDRFVELSGEAARPAVRAYAGLTLARHVYLSTRFPDRRPYTERLLELCEERLEGRPD
jgi:Phosphotransferase enzyme family